MSTRRRLVVVLAPDEYRELARQAKLEERDPQQQARWLLRQVLRLGPPETDQDGDPDPVELAV